MATKIAGMLTRDDLCRLIDSGEVDTVITVFPDMYGRLMGKRITGRFFMSEVVDGGMHCCDYLLACDMEMDPIPGYELASWDKGYGDFRAVPDLDTLRLASWVDRSAIVICDVYQESADELVTVAPRSILKKQLERARALGYTACAGSELEFFTLSDSFDAAAEKNFESLSTYGWYVEDYHTLRTAAEEPLVGAIRRAMDASGVPVEFSKGEWGPGQHEINLRFADMLEMADRHCIYKQAAKELAMQQGMSVTFMAKVDEKLAGNSCHIHSSLWRGADASESVFAGSEAGLPGLDTGCSDEFRWYLGGLLAHARESSLLFAPYVNSYKRYMPSTFAPTTIAWSYDNRTTGFRVVGHGASLRVECRVPGADVNPYVAFAATLAAGLDGIEARTEPPPAFSGDAYAADGLPKVPASIEEAIGEFRGSEFFERSLGPEVVRHYAHFAETELSKFRSSVTGWERRRYLERG